MTSQSKIFVVDDDSGMRESLGILFELADYAVESFACAEDFMAEVTESCEGCIVLDVDMPGMSGPELHEELLRRDINIPVVYLTGYATVKLATKAMRNGAVDCLSKPAPGWLLLERAEEGIRRSREFLREEENRRLAGGIVSALTPRETEILKLLVAGHSNKEVAKLLSISDRTVENHRSHIMFKTKTSNLLELSRIAAHAGLG